MKATVQQSLLIFIGGQIAFDDYIKDEKV